MPPAFIKTIGELINWQYAKIIAKSSGFYKGEDEAQYGFVTQKFKELQSGKIKWSDILREDLKIEKKCAYCDSTENLSKDHIIPPKKLNPPANCKLLSEIHNIIWACKSCNSSKGDTDLYEWYGVKRRNQIPRIVEGKYLKLAYACNKCRGTLNNTSKGKISVFDIGFIFRTSCKQN